MKSAIETLELNRSPARKTARTYMLPNEVIDLLNYLWGATHVSPGEIVSRAIINMAIRHSEREKDVKALQLARAAAHSIGENLTTAKTTEEIEE